MMKTVWLAAGLAAAGCGGDDEPTFIGLESLPLDLGAVNYSAILPHRATYGNAFPVQDFGFTFTVQGMSKTNPQPTFWAPLGTVVLAPVTAKVVSVTTLYSGDWSIHYETNASGARWETEHVIDVLVAEGDLVQAGQPVAKVSDYECEYSKRMFGNETYCGLGVGIVEFGLLFGGSTPKHECPFTAEYMNPADAARIESELAAARMTVETMLGDSSYYNEGSWAGTNCVLLTPVDG